MKYPDDHIATLLFKKLEGTLTLEEEKLLADWSVETSGNRLLLKEIEDEEIIAADLQATHPENWQLARQRMYNTVMSYANPLNTVGLDQHNHFSPSSLKLRRTIKTTWFKWAAIFILTFGAGTYIFFYAFVNNKTMPSSAEALSAMDDVPPGNDKAILTLSNGQQITLNKVPASETIKDGDLSFENNNGQLSYIDNQDVSEDDPNSEEISINIMSTPKGGQYQLKLADGTKVWLNAASSITYPTAFKGDSRIVSITGEAYFEIKADPAKPFKVRTTSDEIQVLGTSFNVNAYDDSPAKTSLLEGKIKIGNHILKPREAFVNGKVVSTNIEQDIAWKSGIFNFNDLPFETAMNQFARWYDVNIIYDSGIPSEKISGEMGRNLTLREALDGLNNTVAQFALEGRTVHVIASK